MHWQTARFDIDLTIPRVMGIVNVTPDSFSDGGQHASTAAALRHCEQLIRDGAHLLDIGGESTRPGSPAVPLDVELARVLPVLKEACRLGLPISVDTYKPEVMQAALDVGVDIVNDIWALRLGNAVSVVASHPRCGICLMHMHRDPQTMQVAPMEGDVLPDVIGFLSGRAGVLASAGVAQARIVLDPGVGFGKTVAQNFSLLARQAELLPLGFGLLAGWSRKSSLGAITGRDAPADRVAASVSAAVLAVERGARVVRVHDVRDTVDAIKVWQALQAP
ncbi:MAG: dihydropteroate synthase [Hydrogenophaga sp.]|jgi:dihydropteroate synthase|uniref:dihydropteroate synthase n=1 Tax=Hydrogenophaga sp. TaxID=1904254 RepID=UPI001D8C3C29|nr:dihydropteroate synthase [Hydrogenophaga sp.]MBW0172525.1 dihydropteroate synthase [Hydrogenophaga sp.]MBW0182454.1 dihydropteroate synthase [Hydrogenophaga sp.]